MNSPVNQTNRFLMISFLILLRSLSVNILKQLFTSGSVNIVDSGIYTLSDLGDLSNLIGSLSRTIQQYSPPSKWIIGPFIRGTRRLKSFPWDALVYGSIMASYLNLEKSPIHIPFLLPPYSPGPYPFRHLLCKLNL